MCNIFEVAKKLCEARDWQVSNLELQKMLYISQVLHIGMMGKHLFRGDFEAWDYGPVVQEVYHKFKIFGSKPVEAWAFPSVSQECSGDEIGFITAVSALLSELKPYQLVNLTHRKGTAWEKVYIPGGKNVYISEQDMSKEYKDVWKKKK